MAFVSCTALLFLAGCAATSQRGDVAVAGAGNISTKADVEMLHEGQVGLVNKVDESTKQNDTWSLRLAIGGVVLAPLIYPLGKALWLILPALARRCVKK